jgi:predicted acylesterase/phospholipase RssA
MADDPKPTSQVKPSGSTYGSLIGGGVGTLLIIILTQVAHLQIDAVAGASIGAACAAVVGYFMNGGRAVDTE